MNHGVLNDYHNDRMSLAELFFYGRAHRGAHVHFSANCPVLGFFLLLSFLLKRQPKMIGIDILE